MHLASTSEQFRSAGLRPVQKREGAGTGFRLRLATSLALQVLSPARELPLTSSETSSGKAPFMPQAAGSTPVNALPPRLASCSWSMPPSSSGSEPCSPSPPRSLQDDGSGGCHAACVLEFNRQDLP